MCSTIYSIDKGQRLNQNNKASLYTNNKKIISICNNKKKSTLKSKVINAQWTDLQINKKK